jgi:hypothetical protein
MKFNLIKRPWSTVAVGALLVVFWTPVAPSQTLAPEAVTDGNPAAGGDACAAGVVLDDGTLETGYGWVPSVLDGRYVQRFERADFVSRRMEEICICWTRNRSDDEISFSVQLYRDQGGRPALEPQASLEAVATIVPTFPDGAFYTVDVSGIDMRAVTDVFYLGVQWDPSRDQFFFVCADHSEGTPVTDGWFIDDRADEWTSVLDTIDPIFLNHRAMLVRGRAMEGDFPLVPTLSGWGIVLLVVVIAGFGALLLRRRRD